MKYYGRRNRLKLVFASIKMLYTKKKVYIKNTERVRIVSDI